MKMPFRQSTKILFASLALCLLFAPTVLAAQAVKVENLKNKPIPDWTLARPDGTKLTLSSLKGQVVVLDFWATWCGPCRLAMPGIEKLHKQFGAGKQGVRFIGVNAWEQDDTNKLALNYMKSQGFTYDLVLNADEVAQKYGIEGIPTLLVIDKKGVVREVKVGYDPQLESSLGKAVASLSKE